MHVKKRIGNVVELGPGSERYMGIDIKKELKAGSLAGYQDAEITLEPVRQYSGMKW